MKISNDALTTIVDAATIIVPIIIAAFAFTLIFKGHRPRRAASVDGVWLPTTRVTATAQEPLALTIQQSMLELGVQPDSLLWHLTRLPGLKVVASRRPSQWGFEAYFLYKDRLFILRMRTGVVRIALLEQPANEALFAEVETHIQNYQWLKTLLWQLSNPLRLVLVPGYPPRAVLDKYYPNRIQTGE